MMYATEASFGLGIKFHGTRLFGLAQGVHVTACPGILPLGGPSISRSTSKNVQMVRMYKRAGNVFLIVLQVGYDIC